MSCMGDGPPAEIPVGAAILEAEAWADFAVVMAVMIETQKAPFVLVTFISTVWNSGLDVKYLEVAFRCGLI